jgi:hypothetical protein
MIGGTGPLRHVRLVASSFAIASTFLLPAARDEALSCGRWHPLVDALI